MQGGWVGGTAAGGGYSCALIRCLPIPPFICPTQFYFNQLSHLVHEYDSVVGQLQATVKPLIRPHLEDMERKISPGFALLTWTSMNIDGYLHRFKQGLSRLEELVRKVMRHVMGQGRDVNINAGPRRGGAMLAWMGQGWGLAAYPSAAV